MVPGRVRAERAASSAVLTALVAALALTSCGRGGGGKHESKSTSSATSSVVSPSHATATTSVAVTQRRCRTAQDAAQRLHDAWAAHDVDGGRACASDEAVGTLFGSTAAGPAPGEHFAGCDEKGGPPVSCSFAYEGGAITMKVAGSAANGYHVESVEFVAD
jgi:hypothetical protein